MVHMRGQMRPSRLFNDIGRTATRAAAVVLISAACILSAAGRGEARSLKLVAFGDSLTAGLGVSPADSFPGQLEKALRDKSHDVTVLNAGVSGDTLQNGLDRFDWSIPDDADAVILELGANDTLRGIDPAISRATLDKLLSRLQTRKLPVLLAGMKAAANWGNSYVDAFEAMYTDLAAKYALPLYPFFLDGVALDPALNQQDGLHPNPKGVAIIVSRILPAVETLLTKIPAKP